MKKHFLQKELGAAGSVDWNPRAAGILNFEARFGPESTAAVAFFVVASSFAATLIAADTGPEPVQP